MQFRIDKSKYKKELNLAMDQVRLLADLAVRAHDTIEIDMYFSSAATIATLVQHLLNEESSSNLHESQWEKAIELKSKKA
jgi:hypothetical protein